MKTTILDCLEAGGKVLRAGFNRAHSVSQKESASSIVTECDVASEEAIVSLIQTRHPGDNVIGEETGYAWRGSELTWVVDPLDGTSNYAAGLPWFAILIAVMRGAETIAAGVSFPLGGSLYYSEKGGGVWRDGQRVHVSREPRLSNMLCSYGFDSSKDEAATRRTVTQLARLANASRNVRCTNCFLDFAHTIDGRFGACVNLSTKIWDIAGAALMFPEAGGRLVDTSGAPVVFSLDRHDYNRSYAVIGAGPELLPQVLEAMKG